MLRRQRNRRPPLDTVNVNANLNKLSTGDLYDCAEASIMMAGYHLSQARTDPNGAHVEQAMEQCQFALEALRALTTR